MPEASEAIAASLLAAFDGATCRTVPFRHWLLERALPEHVRTALAELPFGPSVIGDTRGKRETHNATRRFVSPATRAAYSVCDELAAALQSPAVVAALAARTGAPLGGGFLRIEHCRDSDGFWLEPHTDIGAKLFTMLIYLAPDDATLGTDICDAAGNLVARAPFRSNTGLVFVPAHDTWHGFARRPIAGVRRSLIVNYVKDEWRARHELAYPDAPALSPDGHRASCR
jgi:hypothetical protein